CFFVQSIKDFFAPAMALFSCPTIDPLSDKYHDLCSCWHRPPRNPHIKFHAPGQSIALVNLVFKGGYLSLLLVDDFYPVIKRVEGCRHELRNSFQRRINNFDQFCFCYLWLLHTHISFP